LTESPQPESTARRVQELTPGGLAGVSGVVRYRPEFDEVYLRPLVTICYLVVLMSKRKFTKKHTVATPDLAPASLAQLKTFERLRKRADRALLKRRRQKSGQ